MKTKLHLLAAKHLLISLFVIAGISATVSAQYLISSKAGFVNSVDGKVRIQRHGDSTSDTMKATLGAQLSNGDRLTTDTGAFAELLLSPGSYLRLNESSEVVATNTSLSETRFNIIRGSVIVEVGDIDKKTPIEIETPSGLISIPKIGIYRFDVKGDQVSVNVRQGELFLGSREQLLAKTATKVKSKKVVHLNKTGVSEIAKLSPKVFDDFDIRCYKRAETLVAANYSVLRRSQNLNSSIYGWAYDPFTNSYTYIPRGFYYASPYGFGFYRSWVDCGYCNPYYYYSPYPSGNTNNQNAGNNNGGGSGTQATPSRPPVAGLNHREGLSRRDNETGRQVEPYSRPQAPVPSRVDNNPYSSPAYRPDVFSPSSSSSSGSTSSPAASPAPSPSRDTGGIDRGGVSGRSGAGGRGVQ